MAIKKIIMRPEGTNDYGDILHPETSADMVKMSDNSTVEEKIAAHLAEKATQNEYGHIRLQDVDNVVDNKVRIVDNMLELNIEGEWQMFKLIPPEDTTDAPGSKFLIAGTMAEGFFGEVPASQLITGDALASQVGISAGTSQFSSEGWLKFAYQGKIQFVAKKPIRHSISWDNINSANCIYGDKTITIGGLTYKVRLMRGANKDPAGGREGSINHNSEWNKLMLPIHIEARILNWNRPNNVEVDVPYWGINFTDADLHTHSGHGSGTYSWCQEVAESSDTRLVRGTNGVSRSLSYITSFSDFYAGFRPVLELVE